MDMKDNVALFESLPRPEILPNSERNHWVVSVGRLPIDPPGDFILAILPEQRILQRGPEDILSESGNLEREAEALIPLLLDLFIKGGEFSVGDQPAIPQPLAPFTWALRNHRMVQAINNRLVHYGIGNGTELGTLHVCTAKEWDLVDGIWDKLRYMIVDLMCLQIYPGDSSRCHGCGLSTDALLEPLVACVACNRAFYHSADCQTRHLSQHLTTCNKNRAGNIISYYTAASGNIENSDINAQTYYRIVARFRPSALALIRALHLDDLLVPNDSFAMV